MGRFYELIWRGCLAALLLFAAVPARAEETVVAVDEPSVGTLTPDDGGDEDAAVGGDSGTTPSHVIAGGFAGYRIFNVDGYGGRAAEFDYLHSSPTFGVYYNRLGRDLKYSIDGSYLNDKDYSGDLLFDYIGDYRFHLRTESMWHNLDRELLSPSFGLGAPPSMALYDMVPDPEGTRYGIRAEQDLATFRYKVHDFPLHVNLGYWRFFREGNRQLIFADQAFEGTTNTIYAISRKIDRKVIEGNAGFDAHLGPVDLIYSFKIRQFHDDAPLLSQSYVERNDLSGSLMRSAGDQQHNVDPNSRFMSHTVKLHTSLAGGIVGAASYSFGKRENQSQVSDVVGADKTNSTLHNVATDFIYTPCKEFSFSVKYRLQDVDNDNPSTIQDRFYPSGTVQVRPSVATQKSVVTATMSIRPLNTLTFIGEYKGSFIHREDTTGNNAEMSWRNLPGNTTVNRGTFSLISRPVKGLRLKFLYGYSASDSPSYGTSFSERHEGKFLATYNATNLWGLTASYTGVRENNDDIQRPVIDRSTFPSISYVPYGSLIGRDRRDDRSSVSVWVSPVSNLTLTATYAFIRSSVDQTVLFTSFSDALVNASNFTSQGQIYSLNTLYRVNEKLDLSLLLQQVHSLSEFAPAYVATATGDTSGISELSRVRTVESTVSARSEYRFTDNLSCILDYGYREYRDKETSTYNGTVHTYLVSLSGKW